MPVPADNVMDGRVVWDVSHDKEHKELKNIGIELSKFHAKMVGIPIFLVFLACSVECLLLIVRK